jgi:hypothetical protein
MQVSYVVCITYVTFGLFMDRICDIFYVLNFFRGVLFDKGVGSKFWKNEV